MKKEIKLTEIDLGRRLDQFLVGNLEDISRSQIAKLIDDGQITVNNVVTKPSYKLKRNDIISVDFELTAENTKAIKPLKQDLNVIYEDENILVINKPAGLVVHPAVGHEEDTLVNILAFKYPELRNLAGGRLGIVHRLDKETSGVMVIAKNPKALKSLFQQIAGRHIKKHYKAIIFGHLETKKGKIEAPIKRLVTERKKMGISVIGRKSVTDFEVEQELSKFSLVNAYPITGRTHQIRVHFAFLGHPILGDKLYSSEAKQKEAIRLGVLRHMLHAYKLGLINPETLDYQEFKAPIPEDFKDILNILSSNF